MPETPPVFLRRIADDLRQEGGEDKYDDADALEELATRFEAMDSLMTSVSRKPPPRLAGEARKTRQDGEFRYWTPEGLLDPEEG